MTWRNRNDEKNEKFVKSISFKSYEESFECEAFKGIPADDFENFVDELEVRFKLVEKTKESLPHISNMDARQIQKYNSLILNEDEKDNLEIWCQVKLFRYVEAKF